MASLLALLVAAHLPMPAAAHTGRPVRVERLAAGPYALNVLFYTSPRAGEELELLVAPIVAPGAATPRLDLQITARPGPGTSATPVRGRVGPDEELPGAFAVLQPLPVAGVWTLEFAVSGPEGSGLGRLAVTAAAPGAIPVWAGWAIALLPLLGVFLFGLAQCRWYRGDRG